MPPKMCSSSSQNRRENWSPNLTADAYGTASIAAFMGADTLIGNLAEDAERNRAHAPVGLRFPDRSAAHEVLELDGDAAVALADRDDLRAIADAVRNLAREGLADPAHAADWLKHGGLKVVEQKTLQAPPQARRQDIVQRDRLAGNGRRAETASRKLRIAPMPRRSLASPVAEVLVERAKRRAAIRAGFPDPPSTPHRRARPFSSPWPGARRRRRRNRP